MMATERGPDQPFDCAHGVWFGLLHRAGLLGCAACGRSRSADRARNASTDARWKSVVYPMA